MEIRMIQEFRNVIYSDIFDIRSLNPVEMQYLEEVKVSANLIKEYICENTVVIDFFPDPKLRNYFDWEDELVLRGMEPLSFSRILCIHGIIVSQSVQKGLAIEDAWRELFSMHSPIIARKGNEINDVIINPPYIYGDEIRMAEFSGVVNRLERLTGIIMSATPLATIRSG